MAAVRHFSKLPVWIVENHNEALEPIYRAIASRHLPFEGIAMLHFDSHPDLQIDTNMPADIIFDKHQLFDVLSIENWIMPAIYAGHLGHVTWVKPPWADQLPEGSRKVKVGKDRSSGKLRVNWPDSYFVSDLLFAPQEDMENGKDAIIDVITMETECLRSRDFTDSLSVCVESRCKSLPTLEKDNQDADTGGQEASISAGVERESRTLIESNRDLAINQNIKMQSRTFYEDESVSSNPGLVQNDVETQRTSLDSGNDPSNDRIDQGNVESNRDTEKLDELSCSHPTASRISENLAVTPVKEPTCSNTEESQRKSSSADNKQDVDAQMNCPNQQIYSCTELRDYNQHNDDIANLNESNCGPVINKSKDMPVLCNNGDNESQTVYNSIKCNSSAITPNCSEYNTGVANLGRGDRAQQGQGLGAPSSITSDAVVQHYSEFSERFILDIDLDFFSTRNPFKQMYTKEQYNLMDELYQFAAPMDESVSALKACQKERAKQISELSAGLKAVFNGDDYDALLGDREIFVRIVELVKSLQSTPDIEPECLDPEMVHMAGLTCDDHGELPHHVSSDEEINSLVATVRELLEKLPTPTMVTISRSSHDDYCPAHQVDGIQHKVIKMLHSLYDKLDIHLEYEAD